MNWKLNGETMVSKLEAIARYLLLIYLAECAVGGSGRWLEIGPLSIRMVIFIACLLVTFPLVLRNFKKLIRSYQVIVTVCFGVYLLLCAGIGFAAGNQLGYIWNDISGFLSLALVPGFLAVMGNRKAINQALSVVFWSTFVLALLTVLLHFILAFDDGTIAYYINRWINRHSLGGMAVMQTGLQRIYLKSHVYLQIAAIYGVWIIRNTQDRHRRFFLIFCEAILLFAWLISYTRGFWLGLAVAAGSILILERRIYKKLLSMAGNILLVLAVLLLLSTAVYRSPAVIAEVANRFSPNLLVVSVDKEWVTPTLPEEEEPPSIVDETNLAAVNMRAESLKLLWEKIYEHPVLGNGLGENLDQIRKDGRTEYMYLDILMKTGLIGSILFAMTYFGFFGYQAYFWRKRKRANSAAELTDDQIRNRYVTASYIGIAITSWFNPFLNNPIGTAVLMLTSTAIFSSIHQQTDKED